MDENRGADRTHSDGSDLPCVWAEWFPAFHSYGADALRAGRPVHWPTLPVALRVLGVGGASDRRSTPVSEPLRGARTHAAGSRDREHPSVSPAHGSERHPDGAGRYRMLGNCGISQPSVLRGFVCPEDGLEESGDREIWGSGDRHRPTALRASPPGAAI